MAMLGIAGVFACGSEGAGSDDAGARDAGFSLESGGGGAGGPGGVTGGTDGATAGASADAGGGAGPAAGGDAAGSDAPQGGTPGGPMGTQPLGALCANTGNCSQAMGQAVCCVDTCKLATECPVPPGYFPCNRKADCSTNDRDSEGRICCEGGGMRFCTKPSVCKMFQGTELP
jgi:hypothetical protein